MIVVLLAALSMVPRELEEAAAIDGAGRWRRARHIVLPLLSPTLFFLLITGSIRAFQAFNSIYALTQSESEPIFQPTENIIIHIYAQFIRYNEAGYGSAVAVLFMITLMFLSLLQWRLLGRRVHYS